MGLEGVGMLRVGKRDFSSSAAVGVEREGRGWPSASSRAGRKEMRLKGGAISGGGKEAWMSLPAGLLVATASEILSSIFSVFAIKSSSVAYAS